MLLGLKRPWRWATEEKGAAQIALVAGAAPEVAGAQEEVVDTDGARLTVRVKAGAANLVALVNALDTPARINCLSRTEMRALLERRLCGPGADAATML